MQADLRSTNDWYQGVPLSTKWPTLAGLFILLVGWWLRSLGRMGAAEWGCCGSWEFLHGPKQTRATPRRWHSQGDTGA